MSLINPTRYYVYYGIDINTGHRWYEVRDRRAPVLSHNLNALGVKDCAVSRHDNLEEAHNLANLANSAYADEVNAKILGNGGIFI